MEKRAPTEAILVENISKTYSTPDGLLKVLDDINFRAEQSESVAIVGVSGSGKSTLLALLAGLDLPTSGTIKIHGENLTAASEDERAWLRNRYIGFVFQQFHLLPNLTALENVALPLELRADAKAGVHARTALVQVGLGGRLQHYPRQLSGGEQQRVALARAYCSRPRILFADEPTGNLDAKTAGNIADLLFELNDEYATTLVVVTHDEGLAARCRRRVRLLGGRLLAS
ncbi:MAG TPA: ABC transporter ATP-binding protein [Gammaproteobacteria bacterium]|jgi:putative ABC transport system ATP-binding protein|nr:ABC transporter ATP-binding protein [Gammaproteobacteria bacterium]